MTLIKREYILKNLNVQTKINGHIIGFVKKQGFSGINNFPTVGIVDGKFREVLEEHGCCYDLEVEAIGIAHKMDLFTIAFVFDEDTAKKMINVGADVICVHLGLTQGGMLGAKKILSLESAREKVEKIFKVCNEINPNVIKLING